jgi:hypothetical protein
MFRTTVSVASVIATVSIAASAFAGPITPQSLKPLPYRPGPTLPGPVLPGPTLPAICDVDPAVASITLTKGARQGEVRVSYEVVNRGRSAWRSGAGQQLVNLKTVNGNTGETYDLSSTLTASAAGGATMLRASTPMLSYPFDTFEFGGSVDVSIAYDPDILIDANSCNDDRRSGNNTASIDAGSVFAFLSGSATSRTFRF